MDILAETAEGSARATGRRDQRDRSGRTQDRSGRKQVQDRSGRKQVQDRSGRKQVRVQQSGHANRVAKRHKAEAALIGQPVHTDTLSAISDPMVTVALAPIDDIRSDADYRLTAAAELVRRTLRPLLMEGHEATA